MPLSTSIYIESKAAAELRAAAMRAEEHTGVSVIGETTWFEERDTVTLPPSIRAAFHLSQQE